MIIGYIIFQVIKIIDNEYFYIPLNSEKINDLITSLEEN